MESFGGGKEKWILSHTRALESSTEKPPRGSYFPDDIPALYSPWNDELNKGSYYYKNDWETIDHFLLSDTLFTGSGWDYESSLVVNHAPFSSMNDIPASYLPRNGRGLSDHFPLLLSLRYITPD